MAEEIRYEIDTDGEEFKAIEAEKADKLAATDKYYDDLAASASDVYGTAIDAAKDYAKTQSELQQERTDLTIEQIEQQKEAEEKDYKKEQSGAYVDFVKQSGRFGAEAETMASQGLSGSGFSESSRVSMFNTYQNRVATAREVFKRAVLNYDNMIADARLQNSSALAEIAYNALMAEIEYSIQALQYNNEILIAKEEQKMAVDSMYDKKWESLYNRLYSEQELNEKARQFDAKLAAKGKGDGDGDGDGLIIKPPEGIPKDTVDPLKEFKNEIAFLVGAGAELWEIQERLYEMYTDGEITKEECKELADWYDTTKFISID